MAFYEATGMDPKTFVGTYGLAEHVVGVCFCGPNAPRTSTSDATRVSAGSNNGDHVWVIDLRIVDPETRLPRQDGEEGEIWVSSDSVAGCYWNRPQLSE